MDIPSESDALSPEEVAEKRKLRMFVMAFLDEMLVRCPKCSPGNAHRFAHRRGGCHRAHPAPSRALARGGALIPASTRRAKRSSIRGSTTPFPDYNNRTGDGVLRHLKRPAAPECASRTPRPPSPPAPVFDFRADFFTLRPWKRTLSASDSCQRRRAKSDFLSV